jgi:hypothetical protein
MIVRLGNDKKCRGCGRNYWTQNPRYADRCQPCVDDDWYFISSKRANDIREALTGSRT